MNKKITALLIAGLLSQVESSTIKPVITHYAAEPVPTLYDEPVYEDDEYCDIQYEDDAPYYYGDYVP